MVIIGLAAGIVSAARLALPLRLAAALALTPVIDRLITQKYLKTGTGTGPKTEKSGPEVQDI